MAKVKTCFANAGLAAKGSNFCSFTVEQGDIRSLLLFLRSILNHRVVWEEVYYTSFKIVVLPARDCISLDVENHSLNCRIAYLEGTKQVSYPTVVIRELEVNMLCTCSH